MNEKLQSLLGTIVRVYIMDQEGGIMATVRGQLGRGFAIHVKAYSGDFASVYFHPQDVIELSCNEITLCK